VVGKLTSLCPRPVWEHGGIANPELRIGLGVHQLMRLKVLWLLPSTRGRRPLLGVPVAGLGDWGGLRFAGWPSLSWHVVRTTLRMFPVSCDGC